MTRDTTMRSALESVRQDPDLKNAGLFQRQVHYALEAVESVDPDMAQEIRAAMPAFSCEDLSDPEAQAVLAWLEEEGLLCLSEEVA